MSSLGVGGVYVNSFIMDGWALAKSSLLQIEDQIISIELHLTNPRFLMLFS